jgi:hypothetical protein
LRTAIGCESVFTQRGVTITGSAPRSGRISKEAGRADDHGGAQDGHRGLPRREDLLDLAPGGEVLGEPLAQLAQPAQVHDALEARVLGGAG